MKSIGIDIGTTSICVVVIDVEQNKMIECINIPNDFIVKGRTFEHLQEPNKIFDACKDKCDELFDKYFNINSIGVTGQMHGILYTDNKGFAVSPLYTWQDQRGNEIYKENMTYAEYLFNKTGQNIPTGYGFNTHFYNETNNLVPDNAVSLCTIADYIVMRLSNNDKPIINATLAASLGFYDVFKNDFNVCIFDKIVPEVRADVLCLGYYKNAKIFTAIGDNQAGFYGATENKCDILLNVGTGSQISVLTNKIINVAEIECRPYFEGKYLLVGSSLCGGYAYNVLMNFFKETLAMFNIERQDNLYEIMNNAAMEIVNTEDIMITDVKFNGTHSNPMHKASISNISEKVFTPQMLTYSVLKGICTELFQYYNKISDEVNSNVVCVSGNGFRKNEVMLAIANDVFKKEITIPAYKEEAAYGAAKYAYYLSI